MASKGKRVPGKQSAGAGFSNARVSLAKPCMFPLYIQRAWQLRADLHRGTSYRPREGMILTSICVTKRSITSHNRTPTTS